MNDCIERKRLLRTQVLERRDAIAEEDRASRSRYICDKLLTAVSQLLLQSRYSSCISAEGDFMTDPRARLLHGLNIAVYHHMRSEVCLDRFIRDAYGAKATVCFPCMTKTESEEGVSSTHTMLFRAVPFEQYDRREAPFTANPLKGYAIDAEECCDFPLLSAEDIDVVIVPLVAFDAHNNRLGYGGGNYDTFLPQLRPDAIAVGVAFMEQQVDAIPCEEHDLALQRIVTA